MVPHPKRQSQISVKSEAEAQQQAVKGRRAIRIRTYIDSRRDLHGLAFSLMVGQTSSGEGSIDRH